MKLDFIEKLMIATLGFGLLYTYRVPLVFEPMVDVTRPIMMRASTDLTLARQRVAVEDTARFIEEEMPSVQFFRNRLELLKNSLAAVKIEGIYCEFGVWKDESINFIASSIPHTIHGFDSFEGLPESWRPGFGKGAFAIDGLPPVRPNVKLHKGWFDKTVPQFRASTAQNIAFMHLDADLYSSTKTVLDGLADRIVSGTVIQFDEFFGYPGWRHGEHKAFREFVSTGQRKFTYLGYSKEQVAIRID